MSSNLVETFEKSIEYYTDLRKKLKEKMPKTVGMIDTLDLLYGDYTSKISTATSAMWAEDFSYQFTKAVNLILRFIDLEVKQTKEYSWQQIQTIFNDLKQQIYHIEESNNLALETPACHLRYTGHNNLTLYAYLGLIKEIIEFAYDLQEVNEQSEIIPMLTVDTIPIVESTLPMDYTEFKDNRFLVINLPITSLYELPVYGTYLYHEIFHYIVPRDRYIRNQWYGALLTIEVLLALVSERLYASFIEEKNKSIDKEFYDTSAESILERSIIEIFQKEAVEYVLKNYDEFNHAFVIEDVDKFLTYKNKDLNQAKFYFREYISKLSDVLERNLREEKETCLDNFLILFLKSLYVKKDKLFAEIQTVLKKQKGELETEEQYNIIEKVFGEFLDRLQGLEKNISETKEIECYHDMFDDVATNVDSILEDGYKLVVSLQEVACDIPMIQLAKIQSLEEYLLLYTKVKKDLTLKPKEQESMQDIIRVGVIIDYFLGLESIGCENIGKLEKCREEFQKLFVGMYFSTSSMKEEQYLEDLKKEAEEWFECYVQFYKIYSWRFKFYSGFFEAICKNCDVKNRNEMAFLNFIAKENSLEFTRYCKGLRDYGTDILNYAKKEECGQELVIKAKKVWEDDLFNQNIRLLHRFLNHKSFKELEQHKKDCYDEKKENEYQVESAFGEIEESYPIIPEIVEYKKSVLLEYKAESLSEFNLLIKDISEYLQLRCKVVCNTNENALWYRGQKSDQYKLLPSLMRNYKKQVKYDTLVRYQKEEYEEFKFRANGSVEILEPSLYTRCDYFALMQHYSVPTNFMDWSEDALAALYFALEPFLDKKKEMCEENAVVYVFSPHLYNRARSQVINVVAKKKMNFTEMDKKIIDSNRANSHMIPNLSIKYNEENYGYLLGKKAFEEENFELFKKKELKGKQESLYLPLAVCTSRLNRRIQMQSGTFLAFNLYTMPDECREFEYMDLENIQRFYLGNLEISENAKEPFLFKIIIDKNVRKDMALWLKAIGSAKERIYPELMHVGERVAK